MTERRKAGLQFGRSRTTKEIRIAYFIDRLIKGGSELQLTEQIRHLKDRGIYQEVFCLQKSKEHDQLDLQCKVTFLKPLLYARSTVR